MTSALYTHASSYDHVTPPGHPEQVARLDAITGALDSPEFAALVRRDAPKAAHEDILRCHPESYLDKVADAIPAQGWASLDADTHLAPGSLEAALHGAGGNVAAVEAVLTGDVTNAFVACRPPGHHAETETAMGFCLFGNVAIAANYAIAAHNVSRVAIVDFDVHHGNGTQDLVWDCPEILFASTHQMPLYPGTGAPHETGAHNNVLNVALEPASGGTEMRRAYQNQILPALDAFEPELVLISAGFDAHKADPLANLNWSTDDFAWVTEALCGLAKTHAKGRVVSTLEGGYDLTALAASVAAHVRVLLEQSK